MILLVVGLILFLGIHSVSIVAESRRDARVAAMGVGAWKGLYSVVSLVGLALVVAGYAEARTAPVWVWTPPVFTRHITLLLMVPVFPLLLSAYLPGRISAATKHPMLLATKIWAFSHLLANGALHDLVLFVGFLAWAVADRISLKRRGPNVPTSGSTANDAIAVVAGLGLYAVTLLWLHRILIGVAPVG